MKARVRSLISAIALFLCAPLSISAQVACPTPWRLDEVLRIGSRESADLIRAINDLAVGRDRWLTASSLPLRRLSRSGEVIDTLAIVDWSSNAVEYEADPGRPWLAIHPLKDLPTHGLNEYLTTLRPDGSAVVQVAKVNENGTPPSFDILVISIGGDTLLHREVEYEPREVTSAMENRLRTNSRQWWSGIT